MSLNLVTPASVPILAVDLHEITLRRLDSLVRGTEFYVSATAWNDVVNRVAVATDPLIVLLEWTDEEDEECGNLCAALRHASGGIGCHLVALGGIATQATLARAMDRSVDDVLSRALGDDLVFRLRRGIRQAQVVDPNASPRQALQQALRSEAGGDVVVRAGQVTGTIHVQDGLILWANVSSLRTSIEEVLRQGDIEVAADVVAAVQEECRSSGAHFMDVFVDWNVIDKDRAREALRRCVATRVQAALDLPGATALFLPKQRPRSQRVAFEAVEVHAALAAASEPPPSSRIDGAPRSSRSPTSTSLDTIARIGTLAGMLEGAISAAILDRRTGASVYHTGAPIDAAIAWSQLTTLAGLGAKASDVMASAGDRCFVTRPLVGEEFLALFVEVSLTDTTVGMARAGVAQLADPRARVYRQRHDDRESPLPT